MYAKCKLKIALSTDGILLDNGVQSPAGLCPTFTKTDSIDIINAGGNNQKLQLFNFRNAISGDSIYKGPNQLSNSPINTGITKKDHYQTTCCYNNIIYIIILQ